MGDTLFGHVPVERTCLKCGKEYVGNLYDSVTDYCQNAEEIDIENKDLIW